MEKKLTAAEVRELPVGSMVTIHGRDRHGYPYANRVFVQQNAAGKKVLMSMNPYSVGYIEIRNRSGQSYTVED